MLKCEHSLCLTRQCQLTRIRARGSALSLSSSQQCASFLLGRASVNLNFASLLEWFRFEATEAQQPLLAEAPALAENLDVLSDDSHERLGLHFTA